jgi:signal transduction histidine kinase/ActR/RegA family two-component response regulator
VNASVGGDDRVGVLLVDDQPARLLSYRAILDGLELNLVEARSGRDALQRLMEREFAAILLDVNMPDMDGFETAALIHRHPRFERTPIIFVTAVHVTDLDRLRGYELGAFDYVYVPVVPEILRNKIQVLAELYAQRQKLERLNRSLERANVELANANSSLQAERARELQAINRTLEKANLELAEANAALEAENIERRRAEDAMREGDRRKNEFLATLSHELRNPLAAIANAAQFMRLAAPSDPGVGPSLDVLGRQVGHLIRLIDDLLDVSRITSGKITLRTERVDLVDVVGRALETVRPLAAERRQRLETTLPAGPLTLVGDPVRLAQVVGNLLTNAIKYTGEGGRVELAVECDAGGGSERAVVRVTDTGIGIAAEMLPKVFNLFAQADHSPGREEGGLGIGLALVRELVDLHGGTVEATSPGPGAGAEFVVRLPLAARPAVEARPAGTAVEGRSRPVSPRRVLLVDDNQDSAESLAALLRVLGHDVSAAYDGHGAIAAARLVKPDLILLDIGMPDMNGYEVARRLRAEPGLGAATLIALTGYGSEDDRRQSRAAGFDGHLVKPIDFADLERVLGALQGAEAIPPERSRAA